MKELPLVFLTQSKWSFKRSRNLSEIPYFAVAARALVRVRGRRTTAVAVAASVLPAVDAFAPSLLALKTALPLI